MKSVCVPDQYCCQDQSEHTCRVRSSEEWDVCQVGQESSEGVELVGLKINVEVPKNASSQLFLLQQFIIA